MIRANLLPRPNERVAIFGVQLGLDALRHVASGAALVVVVSALTFGAQRARIVRIEDALTRTDAVVAANGTRRSVARELSLEVARYQEIEREALADRRSGADAAVQIATIGNRIPADVWLDSLEHDQAGYAIAGGSRRMAGIGATMLALTRRPDAPSDELLSIDGRIPDDGGFRFQARLRVGASAPW